MMYVCLKFELKLIKSKFNLMQMQESAFKIIMH